MRHQQLDKLLRTLHEHDVDLGRDDVQWAFESSQTEASISSWVEEYLHSPTLLSKGELETYKTIPGGNAIENLRHQSVPRTIPVRSLVDDDVRRALKSLETSNSTIEKHTKQLEAQKQALAKLKAQTSVTNEATTRAKEAKYQQQQNERRKLEITIEEISDELRDRTDLAEREAQSLLDGEDSFVKDILQSDDRLLAGLSKLMPKLQQPQDLDIRMTKVEEWCRAVVALRTAEITERIEAATLYRKINGTPENTQNGQLSELQDEEAALTTEINTLKAEIDSVISMAVDYELRQPVSSALRESQGEVANAQKEWLIYIGASLDFMKTRLDTLEAYTRDAHAYSKALKEFSDFLLEEGSSVTKSSQEKKRKSRDLRALVNPQTGLREFLLGKGPQREESPVEKLLRRLDIRQSDQSSEGTRLALDTAADDRLIRLQGHYESTERSMLKSLSKSLSSADDDLQGLLRSAYAFTDFSGTKLESTKSRVRIEELEKAIDDAARDMGRIEVMSTEELEAKRDALISKWA
ncbi:MAG: hypothetical protein M1820_002846 [Bogoriella megaspora]|nr:MAG: hypothetical protein M1820_002846 [Bogoriella megaspora]